MRTGLDHGTLVVVMRKIVAVLAFFGTFFIVWMLMLVMPLGGLGFMAGCFGPMIFAQEANQGPMLGLFITGPAGVVIGAIAGALYARRR